MSSTSSFASPTKGKNLNEEPLHLGLQATSTSLTKITGMDWYPKYAQDFASDGVEGRLVSMHTFTEPWDVWEMHPHGEEVVLCIAGEITLHQADAIGDDGNLTNERTVKLVVGEYVVNPKGVWHTADADSSCTCVFITPGLGTEHKPRNTEEEKEGINKKPKKEL